MRGETVPPLGFYASPTTSTRERRRGSRMNASLQTTSLASDRAKKRERERRARQRRSTKLDSLRLTNDALECAVVVARTLGDDVSVWSDFLDENASRVRHFLLQSLQLTSQVNTLRIEQSRLQRLLQERQLWQQTVQKMLNDRPVQDWEALGKYWRQLSREHYRPWTQEQCQEEIDAALKKLTAFQWGSNKETTGLTLDGWREVHRVDPVQRVLQFELSKTFLGYEVMDYVNTAWDVYIDATTNQQIVGGHRLLLHHEILQQIGPNIVIVRTADRFPGRVSDVHTVYLVFRTRTERGFMQFARSIWCPELIKALQGPHDVVADSTFAWFYWDLLEGGRRGYTVRTGGVLGDVDANYVAVWMAEVFASVVRCEQWATRRTFLSGS